MVENYTRLHKAIEAGKIFLLTSWEWTNTNSEILFSKLKAEDKEVRFTYCSIITLHLHVSILQL